MKPANGFALVAILIIAALIIGAGVIFYIKNYVNNQLPERISKGTLYDVQPDNLKQSPAPSQDGTINWKTYTNERPFFGFQFKYPKNWNVERPLPKAEFQLTSSNYSEEFIGHPGILRANSGSKIIFSGGEGPYPNLDDNLSAFINENRQPNRSLRSTIINGYTAVYLDSDYYELGGIKPMYTVYYISKNNKLYTITRFYPEGKKTLEENIFNQILSTFQFTD